MITIRQEKPADVAAREALLDLAYGPVRFRKTSERLRAGRQPAGGLSFVAVDDGRIVGTVRLWDGVGRRGPPGAAARPARRPSRPSQPRHRLGADAARAAARPPGAATAPCCWSATPPTTAASASRPSGPAGSGCPGSSSRTACSAASCAPARSTAPAAASGRRSRQPTPLVRGVGPARPLAEAAGGIASGTNIVDAARESARRLFRLSRHGGYDRPVGWSSDP